VPALHEGDICLKAVPEADASEGIDCAVICTDHRAFDYPAIVGNHPLVVDTRNALKGIDAAHVFRL